MYWALVSSPILQALEKNSEDYLPLFFSPVPKDLTLILLSYQGLSRNDPKSQDKSSPPPVPLLSLNGPLTSLVPLSQVQAKLQPQCKIPLTIFKHQIYPYRAKTDFPSMEKLLTPKAASVPLLMLNCCRAHHLQGH